MFVTAGNRIPFSSFGFLFRRPRYVLAPCTEFRCLCSEAECSGYPAVAFRNETCVNVGSELKVLLLDTVHRQLEMSGD